MGAESVSWERNLFHGSGICFMGAESLSWERNLFHGGKITADHLRVYGLRLDAL